MRTPRFRAAIAVAIVMMVATLAVLAAQRHGVRAQIGQAAVTHVAQGPELPFPDNPDPTLCGIPQSMGEGVTAVVDGRYGGALVQDPVLLYDSHLRQAVRGALPTSAGVQVLLHQANPVLDYYLVRGQSAAGVVEGWVPAPFVRDLSRTSGAGER